jgi:hypothetical protein
VIDSLHVKAPPSKQLFDDCDVGARVLAESAGAKLTARAKNQGHQQLVSQVFADRVIGA